VIVLAIAAAAAAQTESSASPGASHLLKLAVPRDGQVYLGMFIRPGHTDGDCSLPYQCGQRWGDTRPFGERVQDTITHELGGKKLAFLRVWAGWEWIDGATRRTIGFSEWSGDIAEAQRVTGPASAVFLDWTITTTTKENGGLTVKDIAAGKADAYIEQYAREVKSYRKPLLIRLFGGELNGSWWWGQSPLANPSLTTRDFVNAWRRVVDIFRRIGALNASWAWNVNAVPSTPVPWIDSNIAAYWPGDDYVDWAGGDIYDVQPAHDLDSAYSFAIAHGKPFFLAEWGVRLGGGFLTPPQQNTWLNEMFDYIETHPAIKAISYFNYNGQPENGFPFDPAKRVCLYDGRVCYQCDTNDYDHRLLADSGAGWRQTFSHRVASPRYVSDTVSEPVDPIPIAPAVTSLTVTVKGTTAITRWRGNRATTNYDVTLRRPPAALAWKAQARGVRSTSWIVRGKKGQRYQVRIRACGEDRTCGPWTASRTFTLR
jgi:hypothetical protein